jgi:predicted RNA-binding protein with PIN domain
VRARVVVLASEALSRLDPDRVPRSLRRIATFAPSRRARLAGGQILGVLESDPEFRECLATEVEGIVGDLAAAVREGRAPAAADPVEVAATAYLLRPQEWTAVVGAAAEAVLSETRSAGEAEAEQRLERARRRLSELEAENHDLRAHQRDQVDRVKAENSELRRRLGETRARLREAESAAESARETAGAELAAARQATAAAESETRRLRARLAELEGELAASRRTERATKAGETVRARLLVDTLLDAAQGLRRELALPAVERLPADTVQALDPEGGVRTSTAYGSLPVGDPALLEELLRMPRAHLIVDGYNVTKTSWPELTLEHQRDRLLRGAAALQSRTGAELTVVFDAAETTTRPRVSPPRGLRVRFSPPGVIADDVIRDLVAVEPSGRVVVVASSDQAVARDVLAAGFRVVPAAALAALLSGGKG